MPTLKTSSLPSIAHRLQSGSLNEFLEFLAALAALYLTLVTESVSQSVSDCHFRISTQRVTFETSDPSDI